MKAKSAKLGDVGVYAYVRARGGRTFEGGSRPRVGAWAVSGELEKKEGMFLRKVGRCWRKADLFFFETITLATRTAKIFCETCCEGEWKCLPLKLKNTKTS